MIIRTWLTEKEGEMRIDYGYGLASKPALALAAEVVSK